MEKGYSWYAQSLELENFILLTDYPYWALFKYCHFGPIWKSSFTTHFQSFRVYKITLKTIQKQLLKNNPSLFNNASVFFILFLSWFRWTSDGTQRSHYTHWYLIFPLNLVKLIDTIISLSPIVFESIVIFSHRNFPNPILLQKLQSNYRHLVWFLYNLVKVSLPWLNLRYFSSY